MTNPNNSKRHNSPTLIFFLVLFAVLFVASIYFDDADVRAAKEWIRK